MKELPSDTIIERAAELWARALKKPLFDNGDHSFNGVITKSLMHTILESDLEKNPDLDIKIDKFKKYLIEDLKFLRDNYLKLRPAEDVEKDKLAGRYVSDVYYFDPYLNVDYNPGTRLAEAAKKAGIPESMFSIKSHVYMGIEHVSSKFGYGTEDDNHYPLPDGGWLITTLRGSDIAKVVDYIQGGKPEFVVEKPTHQPL